ncbi:MAG: tRNA (adenosine(37)-N6)-threonylcarbamoyltransferase complex dimerization subunit type 1 TsaB [Lachnospiraceae bacterium]|nr:tRNA (adenosine(37)-N6)-threonylcarbamoyltransferase complex dimerization subunit type 1 TsaB [Lachnospiraceae bacterium]
MRILAMDTSGPVAAVALAERTAEGEEKLIAGFRLQAGLTHSETLMPMLEAMFSLARMERDAVDAVAVTSGPGSFTGLRIGVSAAKGLCFALDQPLVAVPTLEVLAYQMWGTDGIVCPVMDARRGQVYTAAYRFEATGDGAEQRQRFPHMEEVLSARAVPVEELAAELNRIYGDAGNTPLDGQETLSLPLTLLGDGVPPYLDRMRELLTIPFTVAPLHRDRQSAEALAALAFRRMDEGKTVDAASFSPEYLRPSQAERSLSAQKE